MAATRAAAKPRPTVKELTLAVERHAETAAVLEAQRDSALLLLAELLGHHDGGYATPTHQMTMRRARALLAEVGETNIIRKRIDQVAANKERRTSVLAEVGR